MSLYVAIAIAVVVACEIGLRLPLARILASFNATAWRVVEVIGSEAISDHWKEKALPAYAWRIMKGSAALLACLVAIALPVFAIVAIVTGSFGSASAELMRPLPLLFMTVLGAGYVFARVRMTRRPRAEEPATPDMSSDYSALDKTLHKVILGNPMVARVLPRIDARLARDAAAVRDPVYVTGLARAGTTVIMRALHGSGEFASLTYADMPFVLAPNLWAKLSRGGGKGPLRERAHGDGILVDFDAPEALEEVFWRMRCGTAFINNNGLVPHEPDAETFAAYRAYQARICHRYGARRYLAKNNNMMLRLGPLAEAMPDARILVPVRDPVDQATSLLSQHRRFRDGDPFTRDYMRWLVHHEFGPDQRPFLLPGRPVPTGDTDSLDYWLTQWCACYAHLEEQIERHARNVRPVIYERLGRSPATWERISEFVGLPGHVPIDFHARDPADVPPGIDGEILERARSIYDRLVALAER